MRVTTLLNRTIALPGLWVKGIRFCQRRSKRDPGSTVEKGPTFGFYAGTGPPFWSGREWLKSPAWRFSLSR